METMSPQGALIALCIARLPEGALPRHAWAAEVLVEQLWACSAGPAREEWKPLLTPLIPDGAVDAGRVRRVVHELALCGALAPSGIGRAARFTVTTEAVDQSRTAVEIAGLDDVVSRATNQLTVRLLASSK